MFEKNGIEIGIEHNSTVEIFKRESDILDKLDEAFSKFDLSEEAKNKLAEYKEKRKQILEELRKNLGL